MKKKYLFISLLLCCSACFSSCGSNPISWNYNHGVFPTLSKNHDFAFYGMYPQTLVTDKDTLIFLGDKQETEKDVETGYYKHNSEYYVKLVASPSEGATFSNGEEIEEGKAYWFQVEKIPWVVLKATQVYYIVTSFALLDIATFNSSYEGQDETGNYANNYKESNIRQFINETFLPQAFYFNDESIEVLTVDNSLAEAHDKENNPYVCENTEDRTTLLSYEDVASRYEELKNDEEEKTYHRLTKVGDYARAKGAIVDEKGYGCYYLRTPDDVLSNAVYAVDNSGNLLDSVDVATPGYCIRPFLRLVINEK